LTPPEVSADYQSKLRVVVRNGGHIVGVNNGVLDTSLDPASLGITHFILMCEEEATETTPDFCLLPDNDITER
jgi:hypothetical protein